MYRRLGKIDESLTMCLNAMKIAQRTNDPLVLAYAHLGLGISYNQSDHLEQAREQLRRECRPLPRMQLNPAIARIEDFRFEDFTLLDYNPHPSIKAPIAV